MQPRPPTARTVRQIALAALVLVALLVGSLAHNHTGRSVRSASGDTCVACLLHHTPVAAPVAVVPERIPVTPVAPLVVSIAQVARPGLVLDVAPKTSPPLVARA